MPFTVCGEHPGGGGRSEFTRDTAPGAVFKAADLLGDGWMGVHICDEKKEVLLAGSVPSPEQIECLSSLW
jgi:hypothetical protein